MDAFLLFSRVLPDYNVSWVCKDNEDSTEYVLTYRRCFIKTIDKIKVTNIWLKVTELFVIQEKLCSELESLKPDRRSEQLQISMKTATTRLATILLLSTIREALLMLKVKLAEHGQFISNFLKVMNDPRSYSSRS